jgi:serine/threonine-protein phosphatase 6 regulatory ankyrin repeat subunit B
LPWAASHGQREAMQLLLQRNPDTTALNQALYNAAGSQPVDTDQTLLAAGAEVDALGTKSGVTVLARAAGAYNEEVVRLLLARGADVNRASAIGMTALLHVLSNSSANSDEQGIARRVRIVDLLLDKGAALEARSRSMVTWQPTPLLLAIHNGATPLALRLIERGADVNVHTGSIGGDPRQLSALMWASGAGQTEVVQALLTKRAEVEWRNEFGNSALSETAVGKSGASQGAVAQALLAAGAQVDAVNRYQRTPLMLAARQVYGADSGFVRRLLDSGAQVNLTDEDGRTALMYASESGQLQTARMLIERGASLVARDHEGLSALDIAARAERKDIIKLLAASEAVATKPARTR